MSGLAEVLIDSKNSNKIKKSATSILKKYFESVASKSTKSKSNTEKLQSLSDWYRSERLVMVLGAGSSMSYGLPDWNTLLQKLLLTTLQADNVEKEDTKNLAKTFSQVFKPSALISAKYLHNHFKKNNPNSTLAFENSIRDALYAGVDTSSESELLKEIRQFCIAPGRSPNLNSIITYNYDDLLESCLANIDVDIPFKAIHASGMKNLPHELPIYHVHGYLPQTSQLTYKNKVVLSEDGYHQQYTDIYGWSNLAQINKFKDYNCLFIGLSFSDPNLRRILDIAKKERGDEDVHHYCFRKKYSFTDVKRRLNNLLSEDVQLDLGQNEPDFQMDSLGEDLISFVEKFDENDALSFGVGLIWINDYDEIPELLKKVRVSL